MAGDKKAELFEVTGTYLEAKNIKKIHKKSEGIQYKTCNGKNNVFNRFQTQN